MNADERHKRTPGLRLRCAWTVMAGILPGEPMDEFTRTWSIMSEAYEKDPECFQRFRDEVHEYAKSLTDPGLNWVHTDWIYI